MRTREEQIIQSAQYLISMRSSGKCTEYDFVTCIVEEAERRAEQRVRAEIARDSERLDWLERGFKSCAAYMNGDVSFSPGISVRNLRGPDFRSAIDTAREVNHD